MMGEIVTGLLCEVIRIKCVPRHRGFEHGRPSVILYRLYAIYVLLYTKMNKTKLAPGIFADQSQENITVYKFAQSYFRPVQM